MTVVGTGNGTWFVGSCNGGIWKSTNIYDFNPHWTCVTDGQPVTCSSIGAMHVADFNSSLVLAGCGGSTSSMMGYDWNVQNTGDWAGLMISMDGGNTWKMTNFPGNYYITSIVAIKPSTILVGARSNFFNRNDGGIWRSTDMGNTWTRTYPNPVFDIKRVPSTGQLFAGRSYAPDTVYTSVDNGATWTIFSNGFQWGVRLPWYLQMSVHTATPNPVVFMGVFTINPQDNTDIHSGVYYVDLSDPNKMWKLVANQPVELDQDHMPKDRLTILTDPAVPSLIYVAGNADGPGPCDGGDCTIVYRINWQTATWTMMAGPSDTSDGSQPHPDCRYMAWDYENNNLLLTNDGGLFVRTLPRVPGGRWIGVSGDAGILEVYTAYWDNRLGRLVTGAQDNDVQITPPASALNLQAIGFGGCDGTGTAIDNAHCPARMFGTCQVMALLAMYNGEPLRATPIPVAEMFFTEAADFPYFINAYALNSQNPSQLMFWANGTFGRAPGVFQLNVPDGPMDPINYSRVFSVPNALYDLVVGGYTNNVSNPNIVIGVNATTLYTFANGKVQMTPLPAQYADPSHFISFIDNFTIPVLGPIAHGKTMWLAVSPANTNVIAVCGWPVDLNGGVETIWYTEDGGNTWSDISGNLMPATGTIARMRPSGITIIEFSDLGFNAIVVGTVNGVFVSWSDAAFGQGIWARIGMLSDLPLVLTLGLSYEHYSDTLVAATFGRAVYILPHAKTVLLTSRAQQMQSNCNVAPPTKPMSSARFFPPQQSC